MKRLGALILGALTWSVTYGVLLGPAPPVTPHEAEQVLNRVAPLQPILTARPYLLPAEPPDGTEVASLILRSDADGIQVMLEPSRLIEGGLDLDRARASRVRTRPPFWLFVLPPGGGAPTYWVPLDDPRHVEAGGRGGVVTLKEGVMAVRIPFIPRGRVVVVSTALVWRAAGASSIADLGYALP